MRTENINRKFKLHDERRIAAQLPEQLLGLDVVGFGKLEEFPGELLNSFGEFANGSVPPRTRIYRNAQPNLVDAWLLELLRGANIGDRFYLRTGLEYFPWADCRVLDHRWLESLRRVLGTNQGYIAHDKNSAVMTIGAQYEVLGFATGPALPPAAGSEPSAAPAEDATRRIVRAPADIADHATAVLSGDLRARRLAALSADAAAAATPASVPVGPTLDGPPVPAPAAISDQPPAPVLDTPAPQPADRVAPPEPVASPAPEPVTPPQIAPEASAPAATPTAHADEAPTQLITRIVVPTEGD